MTNNSVAICPVCEAEVRISKDPVVAELLVCDACSSPLEVRGLDPVVLAEAPQEEEDWGE